MVKLLELYVLIQMLRLVRWSLHIFEQQHVHTDTNPKLVRNEIDRIKEEGYLSVLKPFRIRGHPTVELKGYGNNSAYSLPKHSGIPEVGLLVLNQPKNIEARNRIRAFKIPGYKIQPVFVMGTNNLTKGARIAMEQRQNNDLIILNVKESYRNLPYKTVAGLRYFNNHRPVDFIVKIDDDLSINLNLLKKELDKIDFSSNKVHCYPLYNIRKWRLDTHRALSLDGTQWSQEDLPSYCLGWIYILTPSVGAALIEQIQTAPFIHVDDLYMTGILRELAKVEIKPLEVDTMVYGHNSTFLRCPFIGWANHNFLWSLAYEEKEWSLKLSRLIMEIVCYTFVTSLNLL